jgi:hypothetical protein
MHSDTTAGSKLSRFYEIRSGTVLKNLQRRSMVGYYVPDAQAALQLVMTLIPTESAVGRGDSAP